MISRLLVVLGEIRRLGADRSGFRRLQKRFAPPLVAGDWQQLGRGVFVLEGRAIPDHLLERRVTVGRDRRLQRLVPTVRVAPGRDGAEFSVAVLTLDGGAVLLAPGSATCLRVGISEGRLTELETLLLDLGRRLPLVGHRVRPDGLEMEFVEGRALATLPLDEREAIAMELIDGLSGSLQPSTRGDRGDLGRFAALLRFFDVDRLNRRHGLQVDRDRLLSVFPLDVIVPTHGDLNGSNVISTCDGTRVIDLVTAGPGPFWADALRLVRGVGSSGLTGGRFDRALARLWEVAGHELPSPASVADELRVGERLWALRGLADAEEGLLRKWRWDE